MASYSSDGGPTFVAAGDHRRRRLDETIADARSRTAVGPRCCSSRATGPCCASAPFAGAGSARARPRDDTGQTPSRPKLATFPDGRMLAGPLVAGGRDRLARVRRRRPAGPQRVAHARRAQRRPWRTSSSPARGACSCSSTATRSNGQNARGPPARSRSARSTPSGSAGAARAERAGPTIRSSRSQTSSRTRAGACTSSPPTPTTAGLGCVMYTRTRRSARPGSAAPRSSTSRARSHACPGRLGGRRPGRPRLRDLDRRAGRRVWATPLKQAKGTLPTRSARARTARPAGAKDEVNCSGEGRGSEPRPSPRAVNRPSA